MSGNNFRLPFCLLVKFGKTFEGWTLLILKVEINKERMARRERMLWERKIDKKREREKETKNGKRKKESKRERKKEKRCHICLN